MHVCMYMCKHVRVYVLLRTCLFACASVHTGLRACMCVRAGVRACTYA